MQISQRHAVMTEACFQTFRKSPIFTKCSNPARQNPGPAKPRFLCLAGATVTKFSISAHLGAKFHQQKSTQLKMFRSRPFVKNVSMGIRNHYWVLKVLQVYRVYCKYDYNFVVNFLRNSVLGLSRESAKVKCEFLFLLLLRWNDA